MASWNTSATRTARYWPRSCQTIEAVLAWFAPSVVGMLAERLYGYKLVRSAASGAEHATSVETDRHNATSLRPAGPSSAAPSPASPCFEPARAASASPAPLRRPRPRTVAGGDGPPTPMADPLLRGLLQLLLLRRWRWTGVRRRRWICGGDWRAAAPASAAVDLRCVGSGGFARRFLLEWEPVGDCNVYKASGRWCRYDANTSVFACLCSDGSMHQSTCVSLSAASSLVFACLACLMYRQKKKIRSAIFRIYSRNTSNIDEMLRKCESHAPKRYKYSQLKKITRSFKDVLGEGGYGVVYKGSLQDGRMVAVKLLKGSKGNREDFLNEVMSIGRTTHVNIVSLLRFCLDGSHRALIYEYMSNGSLQNHIYSESSKQAIGWEMFLKIAIGIARGLEYLHQGCNTRIIHFDIKPNNILLDDELCPKIADFGMAKLCHLKESVLSMAEARGTVGFIAPEVFSRGFGLVLRKSNVYSYGMMLLEMVQGKKDEKGKADSHSSETFFPHWVWDNLARELHGSEAKYGTEEIMNPESRPSMSSVIEMLERSMGELEMPPRPFLFSPVHSTTASSYASVLVMMSSP
ncbi:LEAF RUST 10 DISEASE-RESISTANCEUS RECEPTOR-LIKE PROTEIN KINASE-like 2.1 [Triticum aestivum]|uniref:LEAF RUST 10 DISEASE-RESISTANCEUS RECEPTOR-LIKE PROTEIN KINASE-like 2.1 n=1 Tax=Triticum aestivum TaxID=4565 RepID=UPI001D024995|nr:LEAF RUST 10 DISEASE-RESISTANCE LOCUS RECEPTOR-LIKE PROTEIN KINASE-like 2.1 [Triticum aestivum]